MQLVSMKTQIIVADDYDKRGLTKDELLFLAEATSGDFVIASLDVLGQGAEKRPKLELLNMRTRRKLSFYMDKFEKILGPIGLL